ncbi:hypothetical protein V1478_007356 [Vespula squamosa]|uniref:Uncharacterized protein n=1 Tax=Vespula squamosa TaxID=30214 RepID=A0ABD2B2V9_VESSQ
MAIPSRSWHESLTLVAGSAKLDFHSMTVGTTFLREKNSKETNKQRNERTSKEDQREEEDDREQWIEGWIISCHHGKSQDPSEKNR